MDLKSRDLHNRWWITTFNKVTLKAHVRSRSSSGVMVLTFFPQLSFEMGKKHTSSPPTINKRHPFEERNSRKKGRPSIFTRRPFRGPDFERKSQKRGETHRYERFILLCTALQFVGRYSSGTVYKKLTVVAYRRVKRFVKQTNLLHNTRRHANRQNSW